MKIITSYRWIGGQENLNKQHLIQRDGVNQIVVQKSRIYKVEALAHDVHLYSICKKNKKQSL